MSLITRFKKWRAQRIAAEVKFCLLHNRYWEYSSGCNRCEDERVIKVQAEKAAAINKAKLLWDTEKE